MTIHAPSNRANFIRNAPRHPRKDSSKPTFTDENTEWLVIGAIVSEKKAAQIAFEMLDRLSFSTPRLGILFDEICDMRAELTVIDETLVEARLHIKGLLVKNPKEFSQTQHLCTRDELARAVGETCPASIEGYCKTLNEFVAKRTRLEEAQKELQKAERGESTKLPRSSRGATPVLRNLAHVESKEIRWLWPGKFAFGKLHMLIGDPGLGKSYLTLDIAARLSTGRPFPLETAVLPPGRTIILNAEDDAADTIKPRLEAMGADCSLIDVFDCVKQGDKEKHFDLTHDVNALEAALQSRPDTRLVVIDPISAYMGHVDSHKNSDVRAMLAPLQKLAEKFGVVIILVSHLNKGGGQKAVYRSSGSIAFVGAARAAWLVAKCDDDSTWREFLPVKNNIAPDSTGLTFQIAAPGVVDWGNEALQKHADDAIQEFSPSLSKPDAAANWLQFEVLKTGPVRTTEIKEMAKAAGFSWSTVERAKDAAGVIVEKVGGTAGYWQWRIK